MITFSPTTECRCVDRPPLTPPRRLGRVVFGDDAKIRSRRRSSIRSHLVAFLAWVGLGADGLSSSCYGPEEAYLALGDERFLALFLVLAMTHHRARDLGELLADHRALSDRRRRLPGGDEAPRPAARRDLRDARWCSTTS